MGTPSPVQLAPTSATSIPPPSASPTPPPVARPAWLGTRVLPLRHDGFGAVLPTPPELTDRQLPPPPGGPPDPAPDAPFAATVAPVSDGVLDRSTWHRGCPVGRDELAYVTLTFWGFDDRPHTGELLVASAVAHDVVQVFRSLYEARFPIEEMRVVTVAELDAPPTGDGNNTTAFVCRQTRGSGAWSAHARGLAVDLNPFHNPYVKGDLVLPELASAYTDRTAVRPGMIVADDVVVRAFADIGWGWGGAWRSLTDPMHFSATGR